MAQLNYPESHETVSIITLSPCLQSLGLLYALPILGTQTSLNGHCAGLLALHDVQEPQAVPILCRPLVIQHKW